MATVNILPTHISNMIAAGEVVDRPASVVKELTENAIDAGARHVTVEIRDGGSTLIRVVDDGCGMDEENACRSLLRHATSKIATESDLSEIKTLGFRGEALAAISAVAKLRIVSREERSIEAVEIIAHAGEVVSIEACGAPVGTSIEVTELFYNAPARKKFMKKNSTEASVISSLVEKLAISMPHISFALVKDGRTTLQTQGNGDLRNALHGATGAGFVKGAVPVEYEFEGIKVTGLVSAYGDFRPNRNLQSFFVNGRYIRSITLQTAFEEAYEGAVSKGSHPQGAIFLKLPEQLVDVNVHPQKTQIKFANENSAYNAVYFAVKTALANCGKNRELRQTKPSESRAFWEHVSAQAFKEVSSVSERTENQNRGYVDKGVSLVGDKPDNVAQGTAFGSNTVTKPRKNLDISAANWGFADFEKKSQSPQKDSLTNKVVTPTPVVPQIETIQTDDKSTYSRPILKGNSPTPLIEVEVADGAQVANATQVAYFAEERQVRLVGEVFGTYIIGEVGEEMWLIDKHAARERILYEEILKNHRVDMQNLLVPEVVNVGAINIDLFDDEEVFADFGFDLSAMNDSDIIVRATPANVQDFELLLFEIIDMIKLGKKNLTPKMYEEIYHNIACKAAVKGNTREGDVAIASLLNKLVKIKDVLHCPHGRPCVTVLTKKRLERDFLRA